jgi:hypothetical protein
MDKTQKKILKMKKIISKLNITNVGKVLMMFGLVLALFLSFASINVVVNAQSNPAIPPAASSANTAKPATTSSTTSTCKIDKASIRWYNIATPATFIPIIPQECGQDGTTIKPLSITIIPDIIVRFFGFMISLVWVLLLPTIIFAGIWYMWGGIDGTSAAAATSLLRNSLLSLLSLFFFFIIVFTVINLLGGSRLLSTDISSLFT